MMIMTRQNTSRHTTPTTDDGYDDPFKQERTSVTCFSWTKINISGICISSVLFAFIGIAVLVSLAAWSYISTLTSLDHIKTDRNLYSSKTDVRNYKKANDFNDYISDIKNDKLQSEGMIDTTPISSVLPDIPEIPMMGVSAAVPDTPFPMTGSDAAPDKPYIIPAQPNDLNLDLIDDNPHGGLTPEEVLALEGRFDDDHLKLAQKIDRVRPAPNIASKFSGDTSPLHRQLAIHRLSPKQKEAELMLSAQDPQDVSPIGRKLPPFPSLVDPDPPPSKIKIPELNVLSPGLGETINRAHEPPKKPDHGGIDLDPPETVPMTLYRIHSAKKSGAVCLDGSEPAYYHRPGVGPSERLWIIHFNGGAWCFDSKACFERSHSSLGSTNKLPASPPIIQGINSPDPNINPDFHDWNLVWVVYCDGASFTGNQDRPLISESGETIYMRGKRVLNAIINDVLKNRNLQEAEALILTGSSAGSMTAIFQADYVASKLPKTIPVRVFSDAGFFIDTSSIGGKNLNEIFRNIYEMQNSSSGLNQDCIKDVGIKKGWQCFFPSKAVNYVKTPIFVLNSLYDIWALMYFIGVNCKFPVVRQPERKRRSIIYSHMFPRDSELEDPDGSSSQSSQTNSRNMLDNSKRRRKRRDVSGFEIYPFFRTPVFLDPGASFSTPEKRQATSEPQKIYKLKAKETYKKKVIPTQFPTNMHLNDVLSKFSHEVTYMHDNTSVEPPHQINEIQSMLKTMGSVSNEQFNYLAASFQNSIKKGAIDRKSLITRPFNGTINKGGPKPSPPVRKGKVEGKPHPINDTSRKIIQSIRLKLLDFITHHNNMHKTPTTNQQRTGTARDEIKHPVKRNKTRRSTSIAKEYINILRSDPPECTEKELLTAMLYRNLIIRATNSLIKNPKSSRFLISCINHSSSLFDDTWTTLKVGGKTIQQAFGDWFFERDEKGNYDLVDCPYPCNPTCP